MSTTDAPQQQQQQKTLAADTTKIKDSLFAFVRQHAVGADLNLIDDIVLAYVVAVLEEIGNDPTFDVDDFCEMMSAYLPPFSTINHEIVYNWIFELESQLRHMRENLNTITNTTTKRHDTMIHMQAPPIVVKPKSNTIDNDIQPKRIHRLSEMSDGGSTDSSLCDYEMELLQEMFPHVCTIEMRHCLAVAAGDVGRATQILIDRQESGQSIGTLTTITTHTTITKPKIDDRELKHRIIERYSYIDKDSFTKEYKPIVPKMEPKKLVRYRDNKIVSLKGERFTEVKKGEDVDDISLSKKGKKMAPIP